MKPTFLPYWPRGGEDDICLHQRSEQSLWIATAAKEGRL